MKYYGTLGPSCMDSAVLAEMCENGMTGVRINLSHTSLNDMSGEFDVLRTFELEDILIDINGPELRIGELYEPETFEEGELVTLSPSDVFSPVTVPEEILEACEAGMNLLLDDGKIELNVIECAFPFMTCLVTRGGELESRKSIAFADADVNEKILSRMPALTEEDELNLAVASSLGVTGVMLPFVRSLDDISNIKQKLDEYMSSQIKIFAKVESAAGVRALPNFVNEVDCVVIARGDLGNSVPLWELPKLQKEIAKICRDAGTPFMVVTQLLDSMTASPVPTRAEVTDIYNAVLDGCSALMLTAETAVGAYPAEAMKYLVKTAETGIETISE